MVPYSQINNEWAQVEEHLRPLNSSSIVID